MFVLIVGTSWFISISLKTSMNEVGFLHQFAGVFGLATECAGTKGDAPRLRERSGSKERGEGLDCISPLALLSAPAIGCSVARSPSTTENKYQSKTNRLTASIPATATIERSQLDRFVFSRAWSQLDCWTRDVS